MLPEGTLCSRHAWLEAGITPRLSNTKAPFLTHTQGPALLGAGGYPGPEEQEGGKAASEKTEVGPRRAQASFQGLRFCLGCMDDSHPAL